MKMNNINEFDKCSNCGACYNVCPQNAIFVDENEMFYTVRVDEEKCINCGLCKSVCPVAVKTNEQNILGAYGAIHYDKDVLKNSSSGGFFSAVADYVIENGGVVFGATYSENFRTVKMCSTQTKTLDELRRSKYVESKVEYSFREVKQILADGKTVLYCGAPCQIAGLRRYLRKDYSNLITCDFSCGGMPSHKIYNEYLDEIQKKLKSDICDVNFRPKTYGWIYHAIKISGTNGKSYSKLAIADPYFNCFIGTHMSVRDYCTECEFANNHYADIVLADMWKYRSVSNILCENEGISLILTNSQKGEDIVQKISKKMAITVLDVDKAKYNLVRKHYSKEFLDERKEFLKKCNEKGFMNAVKGKKLKRETSFKIKYWLRKISERNL